MCLNSVQHSRFEKQWTRVQGSSFQASKIHLKTGQDPRVQDVFKSASKFKISKTMKAYSLFKISRCHDCF